MPEGTAPLQLRVVPTEDGLGVLTWDGTCSGSSAEAARFWADRAARDVVSAVLEAAFSAGTRTWPEAS